MHKNQWIAQIFIWIFAESMDAVFSFVKQELVRNT